MQKRPAQGRWPRSGIAHSRRRPRQSWASRICGNAREGHVRESNQKNEFSMRFGWEHELTDEESIHSSTQDGGVKQQGKTAEQAWSKHPDAHSVSRFL